MTAMRHIQQDPAPGEIEALLPWHAAGTLNARDSSRVEQALAGNSELARLYAAVREEYAEIVLLNESLGAPPSRVMQKLFAAIDAEPVRGQAVSMRLSARLAGIFASLSPRALLASAMVGALVLLLQAAVIGMLFMHRGDAALDAAIPAASQPGAPTVMARPIASQTMSGVMVRFTPAATVSDITALLDTYQATIVDGGKAGLFRLQLGRPPLTNAPLAGWVDRLQREKIVRSLTLAAP